MERKAGYAEVSVRNETPFEIRERTFQFAVRVVQAVRCLPKSFDGLEVGRQLIRSGTSIAANVEEAHGAESQRDFIHKMGLARKEARESRYWLRLAGATFPGNGSEIPSLAQEADELVRILSAIITTAKKHI